ncbi:unnamed protein product (macronuclear) [Paramecium tetraurelia]|uniref:EF-hand domain-containing protein n=1 Tax=Paramecium tetraurelia TaxID=5888 RepID=A0EHU9_PARTE|nr:uncharacterized protein GSPATT00027217001 [Paramecium tetraurelia]CAK94890.1 unnamed protein product [Paramecium tetraurelia]|eukprot:XP_001462263.1 hypothetical protein (macronuclear) [Paramecium tetraurelia strain d4-2]
MDTNKLRSSGYQLSDRVQFGGVFEPEKCKQIAKQVMELYDANKDGYIEQNEIAMMLSDAYRAMNKGFNPTSQDVSNCQAILDRKSTGRVHTEDVEQLLNQSRECQRSLSRIAQERLEVARRIFKFVDKDGSGFLTEEEVPELLKETYKHMGMNDYQPTKEDVTIWIQMTDTDGDGKVTLEDYEQLVLDSLRKQGISLE